MFIWKICLLIVVCMLPIGVLLRFMIEKTVGHHGPWTKNAKIYAALIMKENSFLFLLLILEGLIANLALLGLIISIPLYFILGI